jgi:hypothetical protein
MDKKITGQAIVERLIDYVRKYVYLDEKRYPGQYLVYVLWCLHTWVSERMPATPYLDICAPGKGSGKTLVLEVAQTLVRKCDQLFTTVRPLMWCRLIESFKGLCTIALDEAEKLSAQTLGDTRSLIASGYIPGGVHGITSGDEFKMFSTFCPKMFAQIGDIQPILRDRSICLELTKAGPANRPAGAFRITRDVAKAEANAILADWFAFAEQNGPVPIIVPEFLEDREAEIWIAIYSVATYLGLHKATMEMLQGATIDASNRKRLPARLFSSVEGDKSTEDRTMGEKLVLDIKGLLTEWESDTEWKGGVWSVFMVERLRAIPTSPWRSWREHGLDQQNLAALLSPLVDGFEKSGPDDAKTTAVIWRGSGRNVKGQPPKRKSANGYTFGQLRGAIRRISGGE